MSGKSYCISNDDGSSGNSKTANRSEKFVYAEILQMAPQTGVNLHFSGLAARQKRGSDGYQYLWEPERTNVRLGSLD